MTAVSVLPGKLGELAKQGFDALVNFEWSKAGGAIVDAIVNGLSSAGGRLVGAVRDLAGRAVSGVAGALGLGGGSSAPGGAPAVAGARAAGGPVTGGLPYIVGEKGPEIFVPQTSDRIETNGVLNSLSKSGGRSGGGALAVTVDASSIEEAGKTAKTAGTIITASLDTTSIDAALGKVSALKTAIGSLGQGGEGGGSGGGSGGALAAAVKAGAKAAGGPVDSSGGKAFGARGDLVAGAKESYDFWREKGLSHAAAAGFASSEQGENNFKAHGYGDRGAAYGSMMWQGPRRRQILQGMGLNVIGASHRQQLEAAHWEMTKGPDAGARRAWKLAQGAKTPGEAAAIHVDHYERPLDRALNNPCADGVRSARQLERLDYDPLAIG